MLLESSQLELKVLHMRSEVNPTRAVVGGSGVVMTCACSTSSQTAAVIGLAGLGATSRVVHPLFIAVGASLMLYGLWRTRRESAWIGLVAFTLMSVAAILAPQSIMSTAMSDMHGSIPWNAGQMAGGALYLVSGALLAYAVWRAFPSPNPRASAVALGGMTLATGCSCCMVAGAVTGMVITGSAAASFVEPMQIAYWIGLALIVAGLYRLGGFPIAGLALVGGTVSRLATGISLAKTGGIIWLQFPKYSIALAGMLAVGYAFVLAYRVARETAPARGGMVTESPVGEGV